MRSRVSDDRLGALRQYKSTDPGPPTGSYRPARLDRAHALAAEIHAGPPTSVRTFLRLMAATQGISDAVESRFTALDDLMVSQDAHEAIAASARKRRPQWKNR